MCITPVVQQPRISSHRVTPWQDSSTLPMLKLSLFESNTPPPRGAQTHSQRSAFVARSLSAFAVHQLMRKFIIFLPLLSLASVASAQADSVLKMDTDLLLTLLDEDVSMQESAGRNPPCRFGRSNWYYWCPNGQMAHRRQGTWTFRNQRLLAQPNAAVLASPGWRNLSQNPP